MNVREKLIELLLKDVECDKNGNGNCEICEYKYADKSCEKYLSRIFADHLIANGVTVQEWISVEDRLPTIEDANETESILAIHKDEKYVGRWLWDIVAEYPTEFTHWMPLPEPPKGE